MFKCTATATTTKQKKIVLNHKNYSQVQHDNFMECDEDDDDDHLKTRQKHACEVRNKFFQQWFLLMITIQWCTRRCGCGWG